jgi:hypothetical protein
MNNPCYFLPFLRYSRKNVFMQNKYKVFLSLLLFQQLLIAQHHKASDYYTSIGLFAGGFAGVTQNGKCGLINPKGELVIPCLYDEFNRPDLSPYFFHGVIPAKKGEYWGVIDSTGQTIVPFDYDEINGFWDHGISIATKNKKAGCINYKGEVVLPFIFDDIWDLNEGIRLVNCNGKVGYFDSLGKQIIDFKYDSGLSCQEGLIPVLKGTKWGYINKKDSIVIPFIYESASLFSEGLASVSLNNKTGFIDKHNKTIIPFIYFEGDYSFYNGYARVMLDNKIGMIDKSGKVIIPFEYDGNENDSYAGGCFIVERQLPKQEQSYALFDSTGKAITGFDYYTIIYQGNNKFSVEKAGKYGVIDNKGNIVVPIEYDDFIWNSNFNVSCSFKQGKIIYIDSTGKTVIPPINCNNNYDDFISPAGLSSLFYDTVAVVPYHGSLRIINRNGQFVDHFKGTKKVKLYYANGVLGTKGKLRNFYREGTWIGYYENGKENVIIHYKHGVKNGEYKYWDTSGVITKDVFYENDIIIKRPR